MARTVGIGIQDFETIITNDYFYIDKTHFIKEWWESGDSVTLITRPRRFGKTLTISMLEKFFSVKYAGRGDLFEKLSVWQEEKYRALQGTYPVISLSFANIKETEYKATREKICLLLSKLYSQYEFLTEGDMLTEGEKKYFKSVSPDMDNTIATMAIYQLSDFLHRYYGKKVIVLLDEYDTPMQEAYVRGYWDEMAAFTRSLFNSAFKTNPWLERGLMTGITRVSKESIFSDLNNLKVVTTTSNEYASSFGFTQSEVFSAMDEFGYGSKDKVKAWYDGFNFGKISDIYNPWSIINFLDTGKVSVYWANTSSNSLINKLIREGGSDVKKIFEGLLNGEPVVSNIDEQIVYNQLDVRPNAIWSLLLASGYLKVQRLKTYDDIDWLGGAKPEYELVLTNFEVRLMFETMILDWFGVVESDYNDFVKALLSGDIKAMNEYMNRVSSEVFSYFDTGRRKSGKAEPERFYHGFVLGLLVELRGRYRLTSNRESGFGRYDVMLEPLNKDDNAIILEFKVRDADDEQTLGDTVNEALKQIDERQYSQTLIDNGISIGKIKKYGFAFEGKKVLIGGNANKVD